MKGTRPLDNNEIILVAECFDGVFEARNSGLFMLGVSTGGRISELLSLTIREVSRAVPVNRDGSQAINDLIAWHREQYGNTKANRPLFPSHNGHDIQMKIKK